MKKIILLITVILTVLVSQAEGTTNFLDTNKVWEYGRQFVYSLEAGEMNGSLHRYELDGTEEYNGRTYHVLYQTQEITWVWKGCYEQQDLFEVDTIAEKKKIGLLREEDNKVYMPYLTDGPVVYSEQGWDKMSIPSYKEIPENGLWSVTLDEYPDKYGYYNVNVETVNMGENDEIVLFDFNAETGKQIEIWGSAKCVSKGVDAGTLPKYSPAFFGYMVNEVVEQPINIDNQEIESRTIKSNFIAQGINNEFEYNSYAGAIGDYSFILGPVVETLQFSNGISNTFWFNNLYDKEGNVIFAGENFKVPDNDTSVETMTADKSCDGRMYDVLGREIRNPQPGTIYIQNGRKFIAR